MEMMQTTVGPVTFQGSWLLIIAILLGIVAAVIIYKDSRKLKGEVFEKPFIYFSMGMFFVTLSLIDVAFFTYFLGDTATAVLHDISFILGLGLALLGSMKISDYLQGIEKVVHKKPAKEEKER